MNSHPRTAALVEKAKEIIQNDLRRVKDQRKKLVSTHAAKNDELVRTESQQAVIEAALNKLTRYCPIVGAENCPVGFAYGDHDIPLAITVHPGEDPAVYEHGLFCTEPKCGFNVLVGPV